MIDFCFDTEFELLDQPRLKEWIANIVAIEGFELGEITYVFCDDGYLHKLNVEFLGHDTFTDIISFDYGMGKQVNGEIFISVDRVQENAKEFNVSFEKELHRVMIHGILHYCGFKDKTREEEKLMRLKEDESLSVLGFDYP